VSEIADFLRARYAERRALAESIHHRDCESLPDILYPGRETGACDCGEPAAVIADCDAKLALVDDILAERHEVVEDPWYTCSAATEEHDGGRCCDQNRRGKPCDCGRDACVNRRLAILAQQFAAHPEHKGEEWAP